MISKIIFAVVKYVLNLVLTSVFVAIILWFGFRYVTQFVERVYTPSPEIDTRFTDGFSKEKFNAIISGMKTDQVLKDLGEPFTRNGGSLNCWDGKEVQTPDQMSKDFSLDIPLPDEGTEVWSYSEDGGCWWFDFAWLEYRVEFRNGAVVKTEKCWHGD